MQMHVVYFLPSRQIVVEWAICKQENKSQSKKTKRADRTEPALLVLSFYLSRSPFYFDRSNHNLRVWKEQAKLCYGINEASLLLHRNECFLQNHQV